MAAEQRLPQFYARQGADGSASSTARTTSSFRPERDVAAEKIAEAVAAVLIAIVPNDLHDQELREQLRPTSDFF